MELSPVLEAYFGGQKAQSNLIEQAKELSDSATRKQQAQEELKQRQQTIDEIAKQHLAENKHNSDQLELSHKIFKDTHDYHLNEATKAMIDQLSAQNIGPQTTAGLPTTIQIPGIPATTNGLPDRTGQPMAIPNVSLPQVNPIQHLTLPSGETVQTPPWKTKSQIGAEDLAAQLPSKVAEYKATIGDMQNAKMQQEMERLQTTLSSKESEHALQMEVQRQLGDLKASTAENLANSRMNQQMLSWGIPLNPDAARQMVAGYITDEATGRGTGNPRQAYGPQVGNMVTNGLNAQGFRTLPSTVRDKVMGMAEQTSNVLATLTKLKDSVPVPNTMTGKVSNILADKFGSQGLSPYKSIFDSIQTQVVPQLDQALGFTPGTLSRSPKLYEKLKSVAPLPGDDAKTVQRKTADAADIFLSSIGKTLSGYPAEQRKLLWQDIANDHPELIRGNKSIADKLRTAGETGMYTPGTLYKTFGGN